MKHGPLIGWHRFVGFDLKGNAIQVNDAQRKNGVPIAYASSPKLTTKNELTRPRRTRTMPYLGQGIADLLLLSPEAIKNKSYSFIEFWPDGNDLIKVLETVNGAQPTVKDYTEADIPDIMAQAPFGPVSVGYRARWQEGKWAYEGETTPKGWKGESLEEIARQYK